MGSWVLGMEREKLYKRSWLSSEFCLFSFSLYIVICLISLNKYRHHHKHISSFYGPHLHWAAKLHLAIHLIPSEIHPSDSCIINISSIIEFET
jgi:hypothetical protein